MDTFPSAIETAAAALVEAAGKTDENVPHST